MSKRATRKPRASKLKGLRLGERTAGESSAQINKLAKFIMDEIPGEPSESEGAVDVAIRLLRASANPLKVKVEITPLETQRTIMCLKGMVRSIGDGAKTYSEQKLILEYKALIDKLDGALMAADNGKLALTITFGASTLAVAKP